jgi:PAS domain S-box-containing protein
LFLPLWMWLGAWLSNREERLARRGQAAMALIGLAGAGLTLFCLLWISRAPAAAQSGETVVQVGSCLLFFGAVESLLRRRNWPQDIFEHYLLLSLVVGFMANTLFLPGSSELHDAMFTAAQHLKNLSYLLVLAGLVLGMQQVFRQAEGDARALARTNEQLQHEIAGHQRVRQQFEELARSLEERVEERTQESVQAQAAAVQARDEAERARLVEQQANQRLRAEISERLEVERALRESESRLQLALSSGQIGIWSWDIENGSSVWDERVYRIFGQPPETFTPTHENVLHLIHHDDAGNVEQAVDRAGRQGAELNIAYRIIRPDQSVRHVMTWAASLRDAEGGSPRMIGTVVDVTAHKQDEEALRQRSRELAQMVNVMSCLYEVARLLEQSDTPLEQICQRTVELLPLSWHDPENTVARLQLGEREYRSSNWRETPLRRGAAIHADGTDVGLLEIGFVCAEPEQEHSRQEEIKVVEAVASSLGRAIAYKRASVSLRRNEQRYRRLFDQVTGGCALCEIIVDETGRPTDYRFLEMNAGFEMLTGLCAQEAAGKTAREMFPGSEPEWIAAYGQVALSGEPVHFERHDRQTGRYLQVAAFSPEKGRFAVIFNDISERKRAEETARESRRRLETLLSNLPGMAYRCKNDPGWSMEFVSEGRLALTGLPPAKLIENGFAKLVEPEDRPRVWAEVQRALAEDRPFRLQYRIHTAAGETKWVWEQGVGVFSEGGAIEALEGFITDVSKRWHAERALQSKAQELAAINTELEQFAYAASHDLQEPLRMISGYVNLLARRYQGKLDSQADEFIHYISDGAQRMQQLIRDLLAYSRTGRTSQRPEPVNLQECIEDSLANLKTVLDESGAAVEVGALPRVLGQRSEFLQLFQNLIGNAVKYRGERPPQVQVSAERRGHEWLFAIRDNGIGIEAPYHEQVFELFQRLHGRSEYSGTGIGLAICKKIVENHGGRIWVDSEPGQGSAFQFTLPAEESTAP